MPASKKKSPITTIQLSRSSAKKLQTKKQIGESYEEYLKRIGAL